MIQWILEGCQGRTVTLRDSSTITVRPMVKEDKDKLLEFFLRIPEEGGSFLKDDVTDHRVIEGWCQTPDYDRILPLLAEANERIVADATLHQRRLGWMAHVAGVPVVVSPSYRNKGLAAGLVREPMQIAHHSGLDRLEREFIREQEGASASFRASASRRLPSSLAMPKTFRERPGISSSWCMTLPLRTRGLQPNEQAASPHHEDSRPLS